MKKRNEDRIEEPKAPIWKGVKSIHDPNYQFIEPHDERIDHDALDIEEKMLRKLERLEFITD